MTGLARYLRPEAVPFLFFGFFAGLPLLLVFSTLTAWLNELGLSKTAIGFFAWISIAYSFKFLWSPLVDHVALGPLDRWFGRRRSWMLLSQAGIIAGLIAMTQIDPTAHLAAFALAALVVAVSSATQDVALDALRIEYAETDAQGMIVAAYQLGYRVAMLVAGAGVLLMATVMPWEAAYLWMAALMGLGMVFVALIPERGGGPGTRPVPQGGLWSMAVTSLVEPFLDFFKRFGLAAALILAFVGLFRVSDLAMAIMVNPFLLDTGFSKVDIAQIAKVYGFVMVIAGAAFGGVIVAWVGAVAPLFWGAALVSASNLAFLMVAQQGPDLGWLTLAISIENLASGFAGTVFIAFLSSLTSRAFTATQYALLSSFMLLPGKTVSGFSGMVVDGFGYPAFFMYSAALGVPGMLLALALAYTRAGQGARAASACGDDAVQDSPA